MHTVGIICEYNPFHSGHQRQFRLIRERYGADTRIVCLMSGNYVQRGAPAIFDKSVRAKAAVLAGADLVLELPVQAALSSAEGFASGGVKILSGCCDSLSFGTESLQAAELLGTAECLLSPFFSEHLKKELECGCSFPVARQSALRRMGCNADVQSPNNILGLEYAKAVLARGTNLELFPVHREGNYHSETIVTQAPSATAVRKAIVSGEPWRDAIPSEVSSVFEGAAVHTLNAGERAILMRLRTMQDEEFETLPFGSEGLWRKLMKACRCQNDLQSIIDATKSKRYTRARIDRMILCAFLGITEEMMNESNDFARTLAFTDRGREILRSHPEYRNAGEGISDLERRIGTLYGLFCINGVEPAGVEEMRRVYYHRVEK